MHDFSEPIAVEFPLRGEWLTPNTPGSRIPSHGTNLFGTRYAFDFLQVDWNRNGHPCYPASPLRYLLFGIPTYKCYCYGKPIYAPCDGTVVHVEDNIPERKRLLLLSDLRRAKANSSFSPAKDDGKRLTGNCIIIQYRSGVFAALCHLLPASVRVSKGQRIKKGEILGNIGHSGNSMFPHLHFQIMDSPDITHTNGLPCVFEQYELFKEGKWEQVYNSIPKASERIRFTK